MPGQYSDWEAQQRSAQKGPRQEAVQCKSCKCEWFEQVQAMKVDLYIISSLGQKAPEDSSLAYSQYLIRCLRCGDLQELPLNKSGASKGMIDSYIDLVKQLEEEKKNK